MTADDYGIDPSIDNAIETLARERRVTCISCVPSPAAADTLAQLRKKVPQIDIAAHLNLTAGTPLTGNHRLAKIMTPGLPLGHNQWRLVRALITRRLTIAEIENELIAQLNVLVSACGQIACINSHTHIHLLPFLFPLVIGLSRTFSIPFIRLPREIIRAQDLLTRWDIVIIRTYVETLSRLSAETLHVTDHYLGIRYSGNGNENLLREQLCALPAGSTEMVLHPGTDNSLSWKNRSYHPRDEYELIRSNTFTKTIRENAITPTTFSDLSCRQKRSSEGYHGEDT